MGRNSRHNKPYSSTRTRVYLNRWPPMPPEKMLIGGFCMRKRAVPSTRVLVRSPQFIQSNQENHLKVYYLGLAVRAREVSGGLGGRLIATTRAPVLQFQLYPNIAQICIWLAVGLNVPWDTSNLSRFPTDLLTLKIESTRVQEKENNPMRRKDFSKGLESSCSPASPASPLHPPVNLHCASYPCLYAADCKTLWSTPIT